MPDEAGTGTSVAAFSRLRDLLGGLPQDTCLKLLSALEGLGPAGQAFPGADMVAGELAAIIAARPVLGRRSGRPQRLFFTPFDPFLVDEALPAKRTARIERNSLMPIWNWLAHDALPAQVAAYEDNHDSDALADAVLPVLRKVLNEPQGKELRRLVMRIGGQRVFDDLRDMAVVLHNRATLRSLGERLVGPIRVVDEHNARFILSALWPFARGNQVLMPFVAGVVMGKLASAFQIVRIAPLAAETDDGHVIASSPLRAVVDLAITDLERLVVRATNAHDQVEDERLILATQEFSAGLKLLTAEIDFGPELPWTKRIARLRKDMAELLRPQLEVLPGRVRALLRAKGGEGRNGTLPFDERELVAIEARLSILMTAKAHASELALYEVSHRVLHELQAFLDSGITVLLDGVRGLSGPAREYRLHQLDAAVKVTYRLEGAVAASLLSKSIEVSTAQRFPAMRSA